MGPPPAAGFVEGLWQLYVMDTTPGNRGVIAGGWSLEYDTTPEFSAQQSNVNIPGGGGTSGPAATYPITFNMTNVPRGVNVLLLSCVITLSHAHPDNLRIVLQSPIGTAVVLMANAGGGTDVPAGTNLRFSDFASSIIPDAGPILGGNYRPGATYEANIAVIAPGPQPPYASSLAAFDDRARTRAVAALGVRRCRRQRGRHRERDPHHHH